MALAKTKKKKRRKARETTRAFIHKSNFETFSQEELDNFHRLLDHDHKQAQRFPETLIIGFDEVGRGCVAGPVCTGAYSASTFYQNKDELIQETRRSRELVSNEMLSTDQRDAYYAATVINEASVEEEIQELEHLSSLLYLEDSKKVTAAKREALCQSLLDIPSFNHDNHIFYSTNFHSAQEIDEKGIVACIWSSMAANLVNVIEQYLENYHQAPDEIILLVDGPKIIANLIPLIHEHGIKDLSFEELDPDPNQCQLDLGQKNLIKLRQIPIVKGDSISALIAAASNLAKQKRDAYMKELAEKYTNYNWSNNVGYGTKKHLEAIEKYGLNPEHRRSFLKKINPTQSTSTNQAAHP